MPKRPFFDFYLVFLDTVVPSNRCDALKDKKTRVYSLKETTAEKNFKKILADEARRRIEEAGLVEKYRTEKPISIFILQHLIRADEKKDPDNMARTILNGLQGIVYKDDSQVETLVVVKKTRDKKFLKKRVFRSYLYIGIREQKSAGESPCINKKAVQQAYLTFQKL